MLIGASPICSAEYASGGKSQGHLAKVEDHPGLDSPVKNVVHRSIDVLEASGLAHDPGPTGGVELESLVQVDPRANE